MDFVSILSSVVGGANSFLNPTEQTQQQPINVNQAPTDNTPIIIMGVVALAIMIVFTVLLTRKKT